jgi:hypothetical protein
MILSAMRTCTALVGLALATATAQPPPSPLEVGPAVGEVAPRFEARDQTGRLRTFEDLRGPSGLVLLFFRSADW